MHSPQQQERYEAELIERYGKCVREDITRSRAKWDSLSADEQSQFQADLSALEQALASKMMEGVGPDAVEKLSPLLDAHRGWVAMMWNKPCPPQAHSGLADLYASHEDFRARYEAIAPGFTDWLVAAMKAYAEALD